MTDDDGKILRDILVHVGTTSKGMDTLEKDVKGIRAHLKELNHSSVRREDCNNKHEVAAQTTGLVKQELKEELHLLRQDIRAGRPPTTPDNRAITPAMVAEALQASGEYELQESEEEVIPAGKGVKYWLGTITASISILSFLGVCVWGVLKVGRYMERVDQAVTKSAKGQVQLQAAMKQVATKMQSTALPPDASPSRKSAPPAP